MYTFVRGQGWIPEILPEEDFKLHPLGFAPVADDYLYIVGEEEGTNSSSPWYGGARGITIFDRYPLNPGSYRVESYCQNYSTNWVDNTPGLVYGSREAIDAVRIRMPGFYYRIVRVS